MKELFLLVFVLCTLPDANTFKCYICSSCNDPFSAENSLKANCSVKQCAKTKDKSGVVQRGCAPQKIEKMTCEKTHGLNVCTCDTELCNGSTVIGASLKMLLFLAASHLSLKYI